MLSCVVSLRTRERTSLHGHGAAVRAGSKRGALRSARRVRSTSPHFLAPACIGGIGQLRPANVHSLSAYAGAARHGCGAVVRAGGERSALRSARCVVRCALRARPSSSMCRRQRAPVNARPCICARASTPRPPRAPVPARLLHPARPRARAGTKDRTDRPPFPSD